MRIMGQSASSKRPNDANTETYKAMLASAIATPSFSRIFICKLMIIGHGIKDRSMSITPE